MFAKSHKKKLRRQPLTKHEGKKKVGLFKKIIFYLCNTACSEDKDYFYSTHYKNTVDLPLT